MQNARSDSPPLFDFDAAPPDFRHEMAALKQGMWPVVGLDEAGRGPLAGPVVAAAIILDPDAIPDGLDDSKRLSEATRERLFLAIVASALAVSVSSVATAAIDATDIRKASLEAMRRAFLALALRPGYALIDGRDVPPGLDVPALALVKGDRRSQSIAAASIVAKVLRDRMMTRCSLAHPAYGFASHKGYGSARHLQSIAEHGAVLRLHRMSFEPIRGRRAR